MGMAACRWGPRPVAILLLSLLACGDPGTAPDPMAAASVSVSPIRLHLMPGLSWPLTTEALKGDGSAASRPIAWSTSDPGVATVGVDGVVTGLASGTATVIARVDDVSDTVTVTVVDDVADLPVSSATPLELVPGITWELHGPGLTDVDVTIHGVTVPADVSGDTLATIAVPPIEAFGACLPPSVSVTLRTDGSAIAAAVPAEAPLLVELAAGDRQVLDPAVVDECEIAVPAGNYIVAAVVVDRASALKAGELVEDSVTLHVWSGSPDAATRATHRTEATARADTGSTTPLLPAAGPATVDLIPDPSVLPASTREAAGQESCPTITEVGDSTLVPTGRDAQGRFDWGGTHEDEWWYLVEQTQHLDLQVDSAGARVWAADAYVREEMRAVMALYETEWVPIWQELYEDELPDQDGNGRMIMRSAWNSAVGGGGGTGVYGQADCPGGWRPGESFYVPMDAYSDDPEKAPAYLRAYHRAVAQHEASHTHDLARRYAHWGGHTYTSQVAAEGIASFTTAYWLLEKTGEPLLGNHDRTRTAVEIDGLTHEPGGWAIHPDISNTYEWSAWAAANGYPQSLQFITWAAAHAVRAGQPVASVLSGLVHASGERTTYGSIFRDATGTEVDDGELLVRWGLSWLVDDRVDTVEPELTIPTWNTAAIYEMEPEPPSLPAAVLDGPGRIDLELGEPDIRLLELLADGTGRFGIELTDRGAGPRLHVQILRTR